MRRAGGSVGSRTDRSESGESASNDDGEPPSDGEEPHRRPWYHPRGTHRYLIGTHHRSTYDAHRLPGVQNRPWLLEPDPRSPSFGRETRDARGRVRVHLGHRHPYSNSGAWQYRYRLVVAYALGRALRRDEHVDHINGVVDDDHLSNLRLLTPELHGALHAWLFEIAGCRGADGRFVEYHPDDIVAERAARLGPVVSARDVDPLTWQPIRHQLDSERNPYA